MDPSQVGFAKGLGGNLSKTRCQYCDRFFFDDRLETHEKICKKLSEKRRQQFDSEAQRLQQLGQSEKECKERPDAADGVLKESVSNWRLVNENLLNQIRNDRRPLAGYEMPTPIIMEGYMKPDPEEAEEETSEDTAEEKTEEDNTEDQ